MLVLLSLSILSPIKEWFNGCGFGGHPGRVVYGWLAVLQEPFIQLLLGKINHLASRLVVWNLLVGGELVQHAFRYADIHARLLECKDSSSISSLFSRFSTGSSFFSTDSTVVSLSLSRSMNVVLFCIMCMIKFDNEKASLRRALR